MPCKIHRRHNRPVTVTICRRRWSTLTWSPTVIGVLVAVLNVLVGDFDNNSRYCVHAFGTGDRVTWRCGIRFTSLRDDQDNPLPYASISSNPPPPLSAADDILSSTMTASAALPVPLPPMSVRHNETLTRLYETVEALQWTVGSGEAAYIQRDDDDDEIDSGLALNDGTDDMARIMDVNSLVFDLVEAEASNEMVSTTDDTTTPTDYVLVILPSSDRVDVERLRKAVMTRRQLKNDEDDSPEKGFIVEPKLAPDVERTCGVPAGSVPPIGLTPWLTIVDQSLVKDNRSNGVNSVDQNFENYCLDESSVWMIRGGGGLPDQSTIVAVEVLLQQADTVMANVREAKTLAPTNDTTVNTLDHPRRSISPLHTSSLPSVRRPYNPPFFAVAPPADAQALAALTDMDNDRKANNTKQQAKAKTIAASQNGNACLPQSVSTVGRIRNVRRIARRLAFCDFVPPHTLDDDVSMAPPSSRQSTRGDDPGTKVFPWQSGTDGRPMAVQLIAGATLCKNDERLQRSDGDSIRRLVNVSDQDLVHLQGVTNVLSRDSLRNWVDQQTLDIVVESYQILSVRDSVSAERVAPEVERRREPPTPQPVNPENCLRYSDLYTDNTSGIESPESTPIVVDDMKAVKSFTKDLSSLLTLLRSSKTEDGLSVTGLVGIDCEWQPSFMLPSSRDPQPVLLLQICLHSLKRVYLFDLQALLRPMMPLAQPMDKLEKEVSFALGALFESKRLVKIGFQVAHDLRQLAASYPHIATLHFYNSVLESSTLAKKALRMTRQGSKAREATSSLSRLVDCFLEKELDKREQCSNWAERPLSDAQIEYAALDAAVTPDIVDQVLQDMEISIVGDRPELCRWENDSSFRRMLSSCRFVFVNSMDPDAQRKLKAKRIVGEPLVVTQTWTTGDVPPKRPEPPTESEGQYRDITGVVQVPPSSVSIKTPKIGTIIDSILGERVGKSKDKCVAPFLQGPASIPDGAKLDFPHRSGYIEFQDGIALFVNMPSRGRFQPKSYPNEWLDDGQALTWFLRDGDWKQGKSPLAAKMLDHTTNVITLFVRMGSNATFLCCGRCRVEEEPRLSPENGDNSDSSSSNWTLINLRLVLLDWKKLAHCTDFQSLVGGKDNTELN